MDSLLTFSFPGQYDLGGAYKDGLAIVSKGGWYNDITGATFGGWGVINKKGDVIIPLKYDMVSEHARGIYALTEKWKTGFANRSGKIIVPRQYMGLSDAGCTASNPLRHFSDGMIWMEDSNYKFTLFDTSGNQLTSAEFTSRAAKRDKYELNSSDNYEYVYPTDFRKGKSLVFLHGKFKLINHKAETIREFDFDTIEQFENGLAKIKKGNLYGFLDSDYNYVITPKYNEAEVCANGLIRIGIDGLFGFASKKGEIILKPVFKNLDSFKEGLAIIYNGKQYGYIDSNYKLVIPFSYTSAEPFSKGLALVSHKNRFGIIDKKNINTVPCKYNSLEILKDTLALVTLNGRYGIINNRDKIYIPIKYDTLYLLFLWPDVFACTLNSRTDIYSKGRKIFTVDKDEAFDFNDRYILETNNYTFDLTLIKNGKSGFVNSNGKLLIPCKYDKFSQQGFSEGLLGTELNSKWGFLDSGGNLVIPFRYDEVGYFDQFGRCHVMINGKWIYINKKGETITRKEDE